MASWRALALLALISALVSICHGSTATADPARERTGWRWCAPERGICRVPAGNVQVRYGARRRGGEHFAATRSLRGPTGINCDNETFFGDPLPNVPKHCEFRVVDGSTATAGPSNRRIEWDRCASEGQTCAFPAGATAVRYGVEGQFVLHRVAWPGATRCDNYMFGDPVPGRPKYCDYRVQR